MPSTWLDNSEITTGLVLNGKISPNLVRPDMFHPPYDEVVKHWKDGQSPETIIQKVGLMPIQAAHEAVRNMNGVGELNWVEILEQSAVMYSAGQRLEKLSKKLNRGEEIEWAQLTAIARTSQAGIVGSFVPLSEIKAMEMPFIPSGWKPWDEHLVGYPEVGLVIVGGNPGVGKTSILCKMAQKFIQQYPQKNVAFFSIEMILSEIAMRLREIETLSKDDEQRLHVCEQPVTPEEVISKAATIDNLGLVVVDYIDQMVRGDSSTSAMEHIYLTLMLGAKQLHCPIIAAAQLNSYESGLPKPTNLRWTRLAEAQAWMIVMPYDPAKDWHSKDDVNGYFLPTVDNTAYLLVWKIRGGFRLHLEDCPGAIQIAFRGEHGWGNTRSRWFSLKKF
jgi:hypothetical protein